MNYLPQRSNVRALLFFMDFKCVSEKVALCEDERVMRRLCHCERGSLHRAPPSHPFPPRQNIKTSVLDIVVTTTEASETILLHCNLHGQSQRYFRFIRIKLDYNWSVMWDRSVAKFEFKKKKQKIHQQFCISETPLYAAQSHNLPNSCRSLKKCFI